MGATMIFWIVIGTIAVVSIIARYLESAHRNRTLQILAEKGQPIPPEIFHDVRYRYRGGRGGFRSGIILMCIGIAIFVFLSGMMGGFANGVRIGPGWIALAGIFPFMIGLGHFISAFFDRPPPPKD